MAKNFYATTIGHMLRDSVNWPAALLFYLIYIGGIVLFVQSPAIRSGSNIRHVALMGGLLGVFAYGTFDLTALALLKGWPITVTIVGMVWGDHSHRKRRERCVLDIAILPGNQRIAGWLKWSEAPRVV